MDPIVELTRGWRQGSAGARLHRHLRLWPVEEPALAPFRASVELLFRFLRSEPSGERDRVFCALLRQARRDELAGLVLLEALLPGLKALLGRILVDAGESDELLAVLLKNAWEQIATYPLERRPTRVAANLLLDIRKHTLCELGLTGRRVVEPPASVREPTAAAPGGRRGPASPRRRGRRTERGGGGADPAEPHRRAPAGGDRDRTRAQLPGALDAADPR